MPLVLVADVILALGVGWLACNALVWALRPVVRLYNSIAREPGTPCFWCWATLALPPRFSWPPLWAWRDRKPQWWGLRGPIFRKYWLEE